MKYPHIIQHDEKDCGAACLSMISEFYGLKLPISKFRSLIKVDNLGANIYGIVTGAGEIGLTADALEGNSDELMEGIHNKDISFPFIARIVNEDMFEHFVVVYNIKNQIVTIGDPGKTQIIKMNFEDFCTQWQEQIITFVPNKKFLKGNQRKGSLTKFFKLITKQKKILVSVFIVSLIISCISLFSATIFEYIIDDAIRVGDVNGEIISEEEHDHSHEDHDESEHSKAELIFENIMEKLSLIFKNLKTVCISIIILFIIRSGLQMLRGYMLAIMSKNVDVPLSMGYYGHLMDLPANFFGTRKTGELMSRFSDASNIRDAVSNATLTIMLDTLMAIFTGIYLFIISYKLFFVTVIVMAIYAIIMFLFRKPIHAINQNIMEGNSRITAYLKESVDGIETVKAYGYEETAKSKTKNLFLNFIDQVVHGTIVYNLQSVLVDIVESVGLVVLLWTGAYLCIDNFISIGVLITYYYLLDYFLDPVKNLIELQPTMQTAIVAAERLNDILDIDVEDKSKPDADNLLGDIEFSNVDFRYGNRNLVLKNVSLVIPKGSKIALVGESGCGKTTLAKLIMDFYSPESGTVTINKNDLSGFSPYSIRNRISYVPQNVFLFSDTIYNNLRMGNDKISDEMIEKTCQLCAADDFIKEMPFGYNTVLEENGNNLSGGQKQRLAIARALLRNPDILILDEATSNLDVITEESIQKVINELSGDMTIIIIAHRLKTIRNCDYIYVMDKGEVIEKGTHTELMEQKGKYYQFVS